MAVTDLRVVCKIIMHFSFHVYRTLLIFLEIVKTDAKLLLQFWTLCVTGYAKDAIVGAYTIALATGKNTRLFGVLD